ncbi:3'-5' exonuclease [Photobacterium piscicola]|uniref:3'-5' exonuclease n=1 Tax=Photobacterium piscicola TaxID=1378299 RepID=UPI003735F719
MVSLTIEQQEIVDFQGDYLVVNAYAGTGKTTVLNAFASKHSDKRWLYLAFNRAIRDEAQASFPSNVECLTSHQLAYRVVGKHYRSKLQNNLSLMEVANEIKTTDWAYAAVVKRALLYFLASDSEQLSLELMEVIPDVPKNLRAMTYHHVLMLWDNMTNEKHHFPMVHDGYLKLYQLLQPNVSSFCDGILFDEAQDVNAVTRHIVLNQTVPWVMVGDKHQQIYRFRGAINAMDHQSICDVPRLALTHSFRYGPNIAKLASKLLQLKGDTVTLVGMGGKDSVDDLSKTKAIKKHHAILHRTVAGVIDSALQSVRCYWVGGINNYRLEDIEDMFWFSVGSRTHIRNKRLVAPFRDFSHYREVAKEGQDSEMLQTIKLIDKYPDLPQRLNQLRKQAVREESKAKITVSTAHRAKGLEWPIVVICDDFPHLLEEEEGKRDVLSLIDEINLLYVAVTRSLQTLIIPDSIRQLTINSKKRTELQHFLTQLNQK